MNGGVRFGYRHELTKPVDAGHFSHLNYTGFIKIVKKHDVSAPGLC